MIHEIQLAARRIGEHAPTLVIGEVGSNHNGDLSLAKRLVEAAAECGVDVVKFQSFRAAWLYPPNCGVVDTPMGPVEFFKVLEQAQLPSAWLPELKAHAERHGLLFLSSPFDEEATRSLKAVGAAALKIASPELNHLPMLRAAARAGLPLLCSTGLCTLADIEEALGAIRGARADVAVALFHCVSGYPTPTDQCNLRAIDTLSRAFGVPVGFSDHTTDPDMVPVLAVAAGARMIEKHFTLDRSLPGPDHPFALEPAELRRMVQAIRAIEAIAPEQRLGEVERRFGRADVRAALGHGRKEIMPVERPLYPADKRSIHAIRAVASGERLSEDNIRILRSERNLTPGLHPRHWEAVLGARLSRPLELGAGLQWTHLLGY
jgi:sialic acid synthase SpsE